MRPKANLEFHSTGPEARPALHGHADRGRDIATGCATDQTPGKKGRSEVADLPTPRATERIDNAGEATMDTFIQQINNGLVLGSV